MDYNKSIENRSRMLKDFSEFFDLTIGPNKFRLIDVTTIDSSDTYVDCLIKSKTYEYIVRFLVEIYEGPLTGHKQEVYVNIPKMSNKGFIITNKEGVIKWRAGITIGSINKVIKSYKGDIETNKFKLYLTGKIPYFSIRKEGTEYNFLAYPYLKFLDADQGNLDKYFSESIESDEIEKNYFKIDLTDEYGEKFKKKFYQLTKRDITTDYISGNDILDLIKVFYDNPTYFDKFSPFDVEFLNQYSSLIKELHRARWKIMREMTDDYKYENKLRGYILTKNISRLFSLQSLSEEDSDPEALRSIQSGSDSNAGAFLSQTNKIYFRSYTKKEQIEYTPDFLGLICPMKTPEGVSLINIKNELARNVNIDEGTAYIEVLDHDFKRVKLDFWTYYRSKILSPSSYDYDNKKVFLNDGKITYLFSGDFFTEKYENDNQFDYIRCNDSDMLAYNTAMIPMMNKNDSVRISMATNMFDQSIPVVGARPPIVATGVEKEIYEKSDMTYKSPISGIVTGIIDNFIKIKNEDTGEEVIVSTPPSSKTMNHTYNLYNLTVKEGDKVKKDQVILASNSFKNEQLAVTVPLTVAYMDYDFYTEEDGYVIREGVCDLLAHEMESDVIIKIPNALRCIFDKEKTLEAINNSGAFDGKTISGIKDLNEFGLPIIGKTYYKDDILMAYQKQLDPKISRKAVINELLSKGPEFGISIEKLPYGMDQGTVVDIQVAVPPGNTEDKLQDLNNYYKEEFNKANSKITEFLNSEYLVKREEVLPDKDNRCIVFIKMKYKLRAKVGDKISNRFASKGSIVKIIPDREMPRIGGPDGKLIDLLSAPVTRFNRKNLATDIESILGLVSYEAYKKGSELVKENKFGELSNMLNLIHVTTKYTNMTDEQLLAYHNSQDEYYQLIVTSMDKKYTKEKVRELCKFFNIDMDEGYNLYLPAYERMTRNKIEVGITNIMRLHFLIDNKLAATSEIYEGDNLVLGVGKHRPSGQKIGEMESWAVRSHGISEVIEELSGRKIKDLTLPKLEMEYMLLGLMINKDQEFIDDEDQVLKDLQN
jgi:hypothetical protein